MTTCQKHFVLGRGVLRAEFQGSFNRENQLGRSIQIGQSIISLKTLCLIVEDKKTTYKKSSVTNAYMFSHVYVEGVEFYATRSYVHLTNEERRE